MSSVIGCECGTDLNINCLLKVRSLCRVLHCKYCDGFYSVTVILLTENG